MGKIKKCLDVKNVLKKNSDSWSLKWHVHVHKYKAPCEFLDFFECFVKIQSSK